MTSSSSPSLTDLLDRVRRGELSASDAFQTYRDAAMAASAPAGDPADGLRFGVPTWTPSDATTSKALPDGRVVLLDDGSALVAALHRSLTNDAGRTVVRVMPATTFERRDASIVAIDPTAPGDYGRMLRAAGAPAGTVGAIVVPSLGFGTLDADAFAQQVQRGFDPLFHLCRAWMDEAPGQPVSVVVATDDDTHPVGGSLGAFARSVRAEHPSMQVTAVTYDAAAPGADPAAQVRRELTRDTTAVEVRYDEGQRHVRRLRLEPPTPPTRPPIRDRATIAITGGAGGVGQILARALAERHQARLVLGGRSAPSDATHALIDDVRDRGGEAVYHAVDVTDAASVRDFVDAARTRFGTLDGVIHAAGVLRDGLLATTSPNAAADVIRPKVLGALHLDEATADASLDVFAFFSSMVGTTGNAGQAAYAFANAALDRIAARREQMRVNGRRSGVTRSIGWSLWRDGGMDVSASDVDRARDTLGLTPLPSATGVDAFASAFALDAPHVVAFHGAPDRLQALTDLDATSALTPPSALSDPIAHAPTDASPTPPSPSGASDVDLAGRTEDFLAELLSRATKIPQDQLDPTQNLGAYGIDSVLILDLTREMEATFGALPKTLFFEYQTLRELAEYFVDAHADRLREELADAAPTQDASADPVTATDAPTEESGTSTSTSPTPTASDRATSDRATAPRRPAPRRDGDVAIIGLAGRYPMADDVDAFWENLKAGRDCITEVPADRWDHDALFEPGSDDATAIYAKWGGFLDGVDRFDPLFFNIAPREAERMDPQERLFLEASWHALEDAGYTRDDLSDVQTGVYAGVMYGQYQILGVEETLQGRPVAPGNFYSAIANRVSYFLDANGPSMAVDTMCSSSLTAIHLAWKSLRDGETDLAIAGGVNVTIHPSKYLNLCEGQFASSDGRCRAFGEGGDGYVPGEGVGAVLLKPLAQAEADGDRIYGVVRGSALNHVGKTSGSTVPSPVAQSNVIASALDAADVDASDVSYVEAHGTGTSLGDPIEINGLTRAFGRDDGTSDPCAIGSVKSNVGHLESAAGIASVTKVLLQMKHGQLAPSLHADTLNPNIDFERAPFRVQRSLDEWTVPGASGTADAGPGPRIAGISAFGAGGSNAHLILQEYVPAPRSTPPSRSQVVPLSARTASALAAMSRRLADHLDAHRDALPLADVAYTLQEGREAYEDRAAFVADDLDALIDALRRFAAGDDAAATATGRVRGPAASDAASLASDASLADVAAHWADGGAVDWLRFHTNDTPQRVALPGYAFERERYWIVPEDAERPLTATGASGAASRSRLHPLVHANTSTLQAQEFTSRFTTDDFVLDDHRVGADPVLPAAASLEMARVALDRSGVEVHGLADVVLEHPITPDGDGVATVHVQVTPGASEDEVRWAMGSSTDGDRVDHVHGRALLDATAAPPAPDVDADAIRTRRTGRWTAEQTYDRFARHGLDYGPSFRALGDVSFTEDAAVATLRRPDVAPADDAFVLHPSLLDGALQAVVPLIAGAPDADDLLLPFSFGTVTWTGALPDAARVVARRTDTASDGASAHLDVDVTDASGTPVLAIRDLVVRRAALPSTASEASTADDRDATDTTDTTDTVLYRPEWVDAPLESTAPLAADTDALVVFAAHDGTGDALRRALDESTRVIEVHPGDAFARLDDDVFTVAPRRRAHYERLVDALNAEGRSVRDVLHLWSRRHDAVDVALASQVDCGFASVFTLAQVLAEGQPSERVRLLFAHRGEAPAFGGVTGLVRSLAAENPRLSFRTVEVPGLPASDVALPESLGRSLLREQTAPAGPREHVRLDGTRQRQTWTPIQTLTDARDAPSPRTDGGTYLITGGLGGVGRVVARHLAETVQANLVLAGRSAATGAKADRIRTLEDAGADVLYVQADVSDRDDVDALVAAAHDRFGALDGVIHAAGVTRDGLLANTSLDDAATVLAPKVDGATHLDAATADDPLDVFVLFSSAAAVFGNAGQTSYAFANGFLDHAAARRETLRARGARSGQTVSINWPLWDTDGMQVSDAVERQLWERAGWVPLPASDGVDALHAATQAGSAQVLVLSGDRNRMEARLPGAETPTPPTTPPGASSTTDSDAAFEALRDAVEQTVTTLVAGELKLSADRLSVHEPFDRYGMESVMVMNVTRELESIFGSLPSSLFFEHQTIRELATHLTKAHRAAAAAHFDVLPTADAADSSTTNADPDAVSEPDVRTSDADPVDGPRFLPTDTRGTGNGAAGPLSRRSTTDVAIVGVSGRYPGANDVTAFWENLKAGHDAITEVPADRWRRASHVSDPADPAKPETTIRGGFVDDADAFDPLFFNISPREARGIDPQARLFLETSWHTLEDAGYTREALSDANVGVYVGVMYGHYQLYALEPPHRDGPTPASLHASIANRVSYALDLHGPSVALDTMCSSSLTSLHLAVRSIQRGECDAALAGGVNLSLHPNKYRTLGQNNFLSSDGRCRAFGEGGDGYVPGEGVGAVLLKPLAQAEADGDHIYAVVRGTALNHGGRTNGYTVPNPAAQGAVITDALRDAGLSLSDLDYVEAHGTGTSLGDPIEITGLHRALGATDGSVEGDVGPIPIGSVKSNVGHLESAAGIAAITKVLLQMKHGELAPSLHAETLNPNIDFATTPFRVQRERSAWRVEGGKRRVAGVSSFGAGGANAHVILEAYAEPVEAGAPSAGATSAEGDPQVVVLSARTEERLTAYARKLVCFLDGDAETSEASDVDRRDRVEHTLRTTIANLADVPVDAVASGDTLASYGFDPVAFGRLSDAVHETFDVDLDAGALAGHLTLRQLAAEVVDRAPVHDETGAADPPVSLPDLAYTLQIGREALEERLVVIATSHDDLRDRLARFCEGASDVERLYRGNARTDRAAGEMLADGEEGTAFVQTVIDKRKWAKLARLWLLGVDIDWTRLHRRADGTPAPRRRVSLPTYPFERNRYWLPESDVDAGRRASAEASVHPMIDGLDGARSLRDDGVAFRASLSPTEALVADHRVQGATIVPGVGYVEMARAAAEAAGIDATSLHSVVLLQPLEVDGSTPDAHVVLRDDDERVTFTVESRASGASTATVHARGELRTDPADAAPLDLDAVRRRCTGTIDIATLYDGFRQVGIEYGDAYRRVDRVQWSDDEILGRLTLPANRAAALDRCRIHPMLMDAALQVIAAPKIASGSADIMLPFAMEQVDVFRPLTTPLFAHVQIVDAPRGRYHVTVVDEHGTPCARITDLTLRRPHAPEATTTRNAHSEAETPTDVPSTDPAEALEYLVPQWESSPLPDAAPASTGGQTVLLVEPESNTPLGDALAATHDGDRVVRIEASDAESLDDALARDVDAVYLLSGVADPGADPLDPAALDRSQADGVFALFRLLKALGRAGRAHDPIDLAVVTSGTHAVFAGTANQPLGADLLGMAKSVAKERSRWTVKAVDVSPPDASASEAALHEQVRAIRTVDAHPDGSETVVRDGRRYDRVLRSLDLDAQALVPVRENGVYVIVGGMGGIGFTLARHLADTAQARLALIGRSPLDDAKREKLERLRALGAEASYHAADASDDAALRAAVKAIRERHGAIHGVVHSALVLRDRSLDRMTEDDLRAALQPKGAGTRALGSVFAEADLDWLLLFSSAQTFAGNPGQSNYAAASSVQDAYGQWLEAQTAYPVRVINWGYWGSVGIVATDEHAERLAAQGIHSIEPDEGMAAVERVLSSTASQVLALKADPAALDDLGVSRGDRVVAQPAAPPVVATTARRIDAPDDPDAIAETHDAFDALSTFAAYLLLDALQSMGALNEPSEIHRRDALVDRLGLASDYDRLFDALVGILDDAGFVRVDGDVLTVTGAVQDPEVRDALHDLEAERDRLARRFPDVTAHLRLLWTCAESLPAILRGNVRATDVVFPDGSMELVEAVYRGNAISDRCNAVVARAVAAFADARQASDASTPLRILEIGAGTGGTSASVLDALQPHADRGDVEYVYTDISPGFTRYGRQTFGDDYPFVEFRQLDVEEDIRGQGFEPGSFDLVLAANVLHATSALRRTVRHAKSLLRARGGLLLNEVTEVQAFTTLTFGLLDGWWLFEDPDLRLDGSPLLSVDLWTRLLREEGFRAVHVLTRRTPDTDALGQDVLLAESDGLVRTDRDTASTTTTPSEAQAPTLPSTASDGASLDVPPTPEPTRDPARVNPSGTAPSTLDPDVLRSRVEEQIVDCVAEALEMDPQAVDRTRPFSEYGVDSIIGVDLINAVNDALGVTLRTTALFDYSSVRALAEHVCTEHGDALTLDTSPETSSHATPSHAPHSPGASDASSTSASPSPDANLALLEKLSRGEINTDEAIHRMNVEHG